MFPVSLNSKVNIKVFHKQTIYGPFSQERASNGKDNLKKKILLFLAKIR